MGSVRFALFSWVLRSNSATTWLTNDDQSWEEMSCDANSAGLCGASRSSRVVRGVMVRSTMMPVAGT